MKPTQVGSLLFCGGRSSPVYCTPAIRCGDLDPFVRLAQRRPILAMVLTLFAVLRRERSPLETPMKRLVFLLLFSSLMAVGCGTFRNVSPPPGVTDPSYAPNNLYGGVHDDIGRVSYALEDIKRLPNSRNPVVTNLKDIAIHSADIPLSAIGDTLTLNMVVTNTLVRRHPSRPNHTTPPPPLD